MDITLSVQNGTLRLASAGSACSEEALEGPSISFQGSLFTINDALSGLVYLVRMRTNCTSEVPRMFVPAHIFLSV